MKDWTIPAANGVGKPFSRWACVLAAAVCGALAGPALARAAGSPPGLAEAQAQINSSLAQVPGASAAQPAVNQAFAMAAAATASVPQPPAPAPQPNPAPAPAPTAPPAPAAAPPAPAQIVSNAVAPVLTSLGMPTSSVPFIVSPGRAPHTPPPSHAPISLAKPAPAASAAAGSARVASVTPAAAGAASQAAALTTPRTAAPAGEPSSDRSSQRGRSSAAAPAGVVLPPRPLPPVPPGPGQDLTAPAQAGGQGQLAPLLVAALAAVLAFARFPFRTRLVPRLAFRRPRRVVLPVWHPG